MTWCRHGYSHFWSKINPKNKVYHFYPFAKDRKEKISELQAITFDDEYANDAQTGAAPPKPEICKNRFFGWKIKFLKNCWCRKMKGGESSETRFGQVWGQSEPSSGGKQPFKIFIVFSSRKCSARKCSAQKSPAQKSPARKFRARKCRRSRCEIW